MKTEGGLSFGSVSVINNITEPGTSVILTFENFGSGPVSVLRTPNNRSFGSVSVIGNMAGYGSVKGGSSLNLLENLISS